MAQQLKKYRLMAQLTQSELAEQASLDQGQRLISYYESGKRNPKLETCRALVAALNAADVECTLDDVFPPESGLTEVA